MFHKTYLHYARGKLSINPTYMEGIYKIVRYKKNYNKSVVRLFKQSVKLRSSMMLK